MNGQTVVKVFIALPAGDQAVYTGSNNLQGYRHGDWLGSSRIKSSTTQTKQFDGAYAPFGESYADSGSNDHFFTGQIPGVVTDIYDFLYREYHPKQGRWISPDPAGLGAVDVNDPQTWNRYAYVGNKPLNQIDPAGLNPDDWSALPHLIAGSIWRPRPHVPNGAPDPGVASQTCMWDDVESDCSIVLGMLNSGAAVLCPGYCSGLKAYDFGNGPILVPPNATFVDGGCFGCISPSPLLMAQNQAANNDVPLSPYAQAVFSQPSLQSAAKTMTNPCTYVGMAVVTGVPGAAIARAGAITTAVADNAPTLIQRTLNWWFRLTTTPGKPGFLSVAATTAVNAGKAAGKAAVATCNQF